MALDVKHLTEFVSSLENASMLQQNLDELQQTVALMQSDNHDEFYDISTRNKKYNRVDAMNGPILLEKYVAFRSCPVLAGDYTHWFVGVHADVSVISGSSQWSRTQPGRRRSLTSVRASA